MGLLQEIFHAKQVLKEIAEIPELRTVSNAVMKENIIQSSIYGVDIEKGAVDIARLRFWLSLIVDEELPRPLPNLDYKIVVGDSLLPKLRVNDEEEVVDIDWSVVLSKTDRSTPANRATIEKLRKDLTQLVDEQRKYFSAKTDKQKSKLKQTIRDLKISILIAQLQLDKIKYAERSVTTQDMFGGGKKDKQEKQKKAEVTLKLAGFQKTLNHLAHLQKHPTKPLQFFDWKLDFPEILNSAIARREGFDVVIGNPPYLTYHGRRRIILPNEILEKLRYAFDSVLDKAIAGKFNSAMFFIETFSKLCIQNGTFCCITDISFYEHFYAGVKKYLLEKTRIRNIVNGLSSFENVGSGQLILLATRLGDRPDPSDKSVKINPAGFESTPIFVQQEAWYKPEKHFQFSLPSESGVSIFEKFEIMNESLEHYFPNKLIRTGESVGVKETGFVTDRKSDNSAVPIYEYLEGSKSVPSRYYPPRPTRFFRFDVNLLNKKNEAYRIAAAKLKRPNAKVLGIGDRLAFDNPKVLIRQSSDHLCCTYTDKPYVYNRSYYSISNLNSSGSSKVDLLYVLALLNSSLFTFYARKKRIIRMDVGKQPQIRLEDIKAIPIKMLPSSLQAPFVVLVQEIVKAKQKSPDASIDRHGRQIDILVYHLYNLTYAEAKVIDPALSEEEFSKYST